MSDTNQQTPEEFRVWDHPEGWITVDKAKWYVQASFLENLLAGTMICIVPGGEIADAIIAKNDDKYRILINGEWVGFSNPDDAYQDFLKRDHQAS